MRIESTTPYELRLIQLSDYMWLCETLEDWPMFGGLSMHRVQGELSAFRRLHKEGRGLCAVLTYNGEPVAFRCSVRKGNKAKVTMQATHPDHRGQGHAKILNWFMGYVYFHLYELGSVEWEVHIDNDAGRGMTREYREGATEYPVTRASRLEKERLLKVETMSAQDWLTFLEANPQIDITTLTYVPE